MTPIVSKDRVNDFIRKYSLGGTNDSVVWRLGQPERHRAYVEFENENLSGCVSYDIFTTETVDVPTMDLGVFETQKLTKLIDLFDDDFKLVVKKSSATIASGMHLSAVNDTMDVEFRLTSPSVIPKPYDDNGGKLLLDAIEEPKYEVVLTLKQEDIKRYQKAMKATSYDGKCLMTVQSEIGVGVAMIVGYNPALGFNNVKLLVEQEGVLPPSVMSVPFDGIALASVFAVNTLPDGVKLYVSSEGLAKVQYRTTEYDATYFIYRNAQQ